MQNFAKIRRFISNHGQEKRRMPARIEGPVQVAGFRGKLKAESIEILNDELEEILDLFGYKR